MATSTDNHSTSNNPLAIGNFANLNAIGNWADAVDQQESKQHDAAVALTTPSFPQKHSEALANGVKTVIEIVDDKETGGKCKVTTTFKVVTKRVPRAIAERKKWTKFGASAKDGDGPNVATTYVAEEVRMVFTKRGGVDDSGDVDADARRNDPNRNQASRGHCRICKSDDHWSVACPYKEMMQQETAYEEEMEAASMLIGFGDSKGGPSGATGAGVGGRGAPGTVAGGKYIPPHLRSDRSSTLGQSPSLGMGERRSDDFTVRVTNLPEDHDTLEEVEIIDCTELQKLNTQELRDIFNPRNWKSAGRIERFYLARDKITNKPKGFAFITFSNRADVERAIELFNGFKFEHLILKVEWTKKENS